MKNFLPLILVFSLLSNQAFCQDIESLISRRIQNIFDADVESITVNTEIGFVSRAHLLIMNNQDINEMFDSFGIALSNPKFEAVNFIANMATKPNDLIPAQIQLKCKAMYLVNSETEEVNFESILFQDCTINRNLSSEIGSLNLL